MKKPRNPYPESIFTEPTKEQYALFHKILKENALTLDKFSAAIGRRIWDICCNDWEKWLPSVDELRTIIVKHTSEMLDNPGECGIYPTGKFYNNLIKALSERR